MAPVPLLCLLLLAGCPNAGNNANPAAPNTPADAADGADAWPEVRWFTEITAEAGLDFIHESDADGNYRMPEIMGSGCGMFDSDNDGDLDLYLINGSHALSGRDLPPPRPRNRLFGNNGDATFTDATDASGLGDEGYGFGLAVGDIDNDGDADVYLANYGADQLYRNNGDGTFTNITAEAGIDVDRWSTSAAFLDYDRDGFLDLYICRYVKWLPDKRCTDAAGRPDYCGPQVFEYETDVLLHNNGDGTFTDVSAAAGIGAPAMPGLGVVCDDFDDDGWPDIAVANDGEENFLWINQRDGTFRERAVVLGVAYNLHGAAEAGMGIVAEDLDGDARVDIFMTHLTNQTNTLYVNRGDGTGFDDRTGASGLASSSQRYTGFGTAAFDIDLDGDSDLMVANGKVQKSEAIPGADVEAPWDVYAEPNLLYESPGAGPFMPVQDRLSTFTSLHELTRGMAVGDIDGDGDLDVLISNTHGPARLYRNDAERRGHWLMIEAVDPALKREAIGARLLIHAGGRTWVRTVRRASSYLSSSDPRPHVGLGAAATYDRIEVRWPDGSAETFAGGAADRFITLRKGEGAAP